MAKSMPDMGQMISECFHRLGYFTQRSMRELRWGSLEGEIEGHVQVRGRHLPKCEICDGFSNMTHHPPASSEARGWLACLPGLDHSTQPVRFGVASSEHRLGFSTHWSSEEPVLRAELIAHL